MHSDDEILALADSVLEHVDRGDAEVIAWMDDHALTRFADNGIHQNVARQSLSVRLRLVRDGRVGVAQMRGGPAGVAARLVGQADRARSLMPPGDPTPIMTPDGGSDQSPALDEATAAADPERRADAVGGVVAACRERGMAAYGAFSTGVVRRAVVNSKGVRRHAAQSRASFVVVARTDSGSGYAERHAAAMRDLSTQELAEEVTTTCARNQRAEPLEPGTYEVVLAPYATAEMMAHLSWAGLSGLAVLEGRSFMRPGERLMSELVTIRDQPLLAAGLPFPFDYEGASAHEVTFIDKGVCRDVVHDTATGLRAGRPSTGHALPMPNPLGPLPTHLTMEPGVGDVDAMVASVRRGLLVTRFWYVRQVHALRTIITGMTREGTFLIENGRIVRPIRDLRFTQSIVDALGDVRAISRDRRLLLAEDDSAVLAPWLHLGRFAFTS